VEDDGIYLQDVAGAVPQLILAEPPLATFGCGDWSPDDSKLAVPVNLFSSNSAGFYIVPIVGGEPQLVSIDPHDLFFALSASWSPIGNRLAFTMPVPENVESAEVFVVDLEGNLTNLTRNRVFLPENPSWSPDGTRLVFGGDEGLFVINSDGTGLAPLTRNDNRPDRDRDPTWAPE
jgi:Tol biopolymer transport system component